MTLEKKLVAFALFACTFMGAVEITIVTTAIPSIVKDLNGFNLSSYIFSVYLLTSAIATTVFGKLSDLYGRKKLLQISIVIFLLGSTLCGLSGSMVFLIISRGIQGLGSGAINTLSMTIIGDVFEVEERAKIQGYNSTVWSIASLAAPVIGGAMLIKLTWHSVFLLNIPVGILSIILIHKFYNASESKNNEKLDVKGLTLISIFIVCLIQAMSSFEKHPFLSVNVLGLLLLSSIILYIFYRVEKNIENPVLPYRLFSKEIFIVMLISFFNSMILIAMDVYNPSFMQSVQGYEPIMSVVPIVPMSIFWVIASFILSKIISRYSTKSILITSLLILAIGLLVLATLKPDSNPLLMMMGCSIVGFGFGGSFNMLLFIVQETLSRDDMGIASGAVMFIRTLGQTLGISAFGLLLNNSVSRYFKEYGMNVDTGSLLANNAIKASDKIQSLFSGYFSIYLACFIIGIVCVVTAFLLPSKKIIGSNYDE
ncbi:MDR family MFS transporter [Peptostreptococcus faecalis]|uniref:MDR family MFS transporter n=1 Tax=Peptostreptococcus faecalis TaxID=2045015 RepID=UPI000C7C6CD4|nr:MDR family MFS transporter [Peptostreptococcus faecalis]